MKPTIKASIGGLAFNLEEDAYQKLDAYLQDLTNHFADHVEAAEIITDIEQRISELLQMRINTTNGVISLADAESIIQIMGNPADFDVDAEKSTTDLNENAKNEQIKNKRRFNFHKKLFRDKENALLGGVFSGLGHYFRIDPTLLRIVFAALSLFMLFSSHEEIFFGLIICYGVLWIVMPQAKTFNQKLSMKGAPTSIENLEEERGNIPKTYRGNSLKKCFKLLMQIILVLLIICISFSITMILLGFVWLHFDTEILNINNYLVFLGIDLIYSKLAVLLVVVIPLFGLLGLSVKLLRKSSFSVRTALVSVIGLICWMAAIIYLADIGYKHAYIEEVSQQDTVSLKIDSNVLYIKLTDSYSDAEVQPYNSCMYYSGSEKNRSVFLLPRVQVESDTLLTEPSLKIRKIGLGRDKTSIEKRLQHASLDYILTDSILVISPTVHSMENPWKGMLFEVTVHIPANKKAVVEAPLSDRYNFHF